ncbi:regulatory protein RecX [Lawsonella clevelandensis]|uniref:Regulatory protein RecX n=1 Tax=Lawsonella clevelandensis TaxID=1528099 RepID=A0A5E3ZV33_9ACTN|nr:regulatory protein RecX [Lawsonella clevelandensis]VHN99737.1 Regulatory protein RecX [Lawsonella clevelandensis]
MTTDNGHQQRTLQTLRAATESVLSASSYSGDNLADDLRDRAREAALRLLSIRERSSKELTDRLRDKGFPTEIVDDLVTRFLEIKLLDDERFAREWVTSRAQHSARGKSVLRQELRHKGIPTPVIDAVLESLSPEIEEDSARMLLSRKLRAIDPASLSDREIYRKQQRRLYNMLARRGFSSELAQRVTQDALTEHRANSSTE